jgi:hypothetical protein
MGLVPGLVRPVYRVPVRVDGAAVFVVIHGRSFLPGMMLGAGPGPARRACSASISPVAAC